MQTLPIDSLLPEIAQTLEKERVLVLEAPPGAGKTTRVPPAILEASRSGPPDKREVVVLEPRRLAARMAARRVAEELGENVGDTVGYQVRFEDVSSAKTRIRFVTEAILTRRLLSDPNLEGVSAVVLDEFHERHLHGDVALALLRRMRKTARPDLKLVVMSATLDAKPAADFLGCRTIRSEGRRFDVAIEHAPADDARPLSLQVASAVRSIVHAAPEGDVLVFLPGASEIRRTRDALAKLAGEHDFLVVPLHGDLSPADQDRAVRRADRRKVILSTNVAESSVTIDGVVAVVDGGLARVASFDAWSGLPRLKVQKVSRASCIQRAGRAGRTAPGRCIRLFTRGDFERRPEHDLPEILRQDLAQLVLELHAAGAADVEWLDAPPAKSVAAAMDLLTKLGAMEKGRVTDIGRRLLRFPIHPRQGRILVEAETRGVVDDAAVVAAILSERDLRASSKAQFGERGGRRMDATDRSDLLSMRDLFREAERARFSDGAMRSIGIDAGGALAVDRAQKQLRRIARKGSGEGYDDDLLISVLAGYPDRVARRLRFGARALAVSGGMSAELGEESVVRDAEWMVALDADDQRGATVVRTASEIKPEWLLDLFADRIIESNTITFSKTTERVEATSKMTYEGLILNESPAGAASEDEIARVLASAAIEAGAHRFAPEDALARWIARARFAAGVEPAIPAPSDEFVRETLRGMCVGRRSFAELKEASLMHALEAAMGSMHSARISALAPERTTLAGGRGVTIVYELEKTPHIASRLQDFFGMKETPRVGGGRVPLVIHLLAPNKRAVQVTSDLAGFWERHYPAIRKELARKYPKHAWPEKPGS